MDLGQKIHDWIKAQHAAGRTVYIHTCLKVIRVSPKRADCIRYSAGHCQVARGKYWDSVNYCKFTAN